MAAPNSASTEPDDPNLANRESLSAAEADAYSIALMGDYRTQSMAGSCLQEVSDSHPRPTTYDDRSARFITEFGELIRSAEAMLTRDGFLIDPAVLKLNDEWESCMATRGYVFDPQSWEPEDGGPQIAMNRAIETTPDGSVVSVPPGTRIDQAPPEAVSLLGSQPERDIALADFDCRAQTNYLPRLIDIRFDLEEQFIQEHQAALDRLVATASDW
ncbi:MAG: hypothetical protein LBV06_01015 [Propionibacteriaceae bacterium]|jgi:hypothetical protein|nr:hypothetical protein [Propionibacteriaceae bacterium]